MGRDAGSGHPDDSERTWPTADLRALKERIGREGWDSLSEAEKDCWQPFLLEMLPGDYVVYINVPERGQCTLARVSGPYVWRFSDGDFNHRFAVDPATVRVFSRNDQAVHPNLRTRLALPGRKWRVSARSEFEVLVATLENGHQPTEASPEHDLQVLAREIEPFMLDVTRSIQRTHPKVSLEALVTKVFKAIPGVTHVRHQGGAGDHGADLLVQYETGLPIPGLENKGLLVVQVKSFVDDHWDTRAVEDIRRAFRHYPDATMGLVISTADRPTAAFVAALDDLREESAKPVALLIGPQVAAFALRYGASLLA